jgi:uncharacterized protein (DUF1330 family)
MTFYSVMAYDIVDRKKFDEAMKNGSVAKARVEDLGANRIASGAATPAIGAWSPGRLNIIEWPSREAFEEFHENMHPEEFGLEVQGVVTVEQDTAVPAR